MQFCSLLFACLVCAAFVSSHQPTPRHRRFIRSNVSNAPLRRKFMQERAVGEVLKPKLIILSMFSYEADVWYENMPSLLHRNITVPGASPVYPDVHCATKENVCQMTLGEGEINAAASLSALVFSGLFDLKKTYFLVAGVAGINPHIGTTGSATLARFAIQFDLQYELDARQIPSNYSSGYIPQGNHIPDSRRGIGYPGLVYGTEVFELNKPLRDRFVRLARTNSLKDSAAAQKYRDIYHYAPANEPPKVLACDTGTSNIFWSGSALAEAFSAYTKLMTNGTGVYCAGQQEDNAILGVLLRADLAGKADFARVAILRTASDFDRAPKTETEAYHLLYANQQGFDIAFANIFVAGGPIVQDVIQKWDIIYEKGVKATNYIGDLFNSLDRPSPDIGSSNTYIN